MKKSKFVSLVLISAALASCNKTEKENSVHRATGVIKTRKKCICARIHLLPTLVHIIMGQASAWLFCGFTPSALMVHIIMVWVINAPVFIPVIYTPPPMSVGTLLKAASFVVVLGQGLLKQRPKNR